MLVLVYLVIGNPILSWFTHKSNLYSRFNIQMQKFMGMWFYITYINISMFPKKIRLQFPLHNVLTYLKRLGVTRAVRGLAIL